MKEKRTYKWFDLPSLLAILGCIGMLIFESIFIFELYDRATAQPLSAQPARREPGEPAPAVIQPALGLPKGTNPPAVSVPNPAAVEKPVPVPAATNAVPVPSASAEVPSATLKTAPAVAAPVG